MGRRGENGGPHQLAAGDDVRDVTASSVPSKRRREDAACLPTRPFASRDGLGAPNEQHLPRNMPGRPAHPCLTQRFVRLDLF